MCDHALASGAVAEVARVPIAVTSTAEPCAFRGNSAVERPEPPAARPCPCQVTEECLTRLAGVNIQGLITSC